MYREFPHLTGPGIRGIRVILGAVFAYHNQPRKYMTLFMGILIEVLWSCHDRLREQVVNVQQSDNVRRLRRLDKILESRVERDMSKCCDKGIGLLLVNWTGR